VSPKPMQPEGGGPWQHSPVPSPRGWRQSREGQGRSFSPFTSPRSKRTTKDGEQGREAGSPGGAGRRATGMPRRAAGPPELGVPWPAASDRDPRAPDSGQHRAEPLPGPPALGGAQTATGSVAARQAPTQELPVPPEGLLQRVTAARLCLLGKAPGSTRVGLVAAAYRRCLIWPAMETGTRDPEAAGVAH